MTQGWAQPGGDGWLPAAGRGLDQTDGFPLKASGCAEKRKAALGTDLTVSGKEVSCPLPATVGSPEP